MLGSLPFSVLVGTVLGFLSALGIGGGSLLILWLTLVLGWEPDRARQVNLLFFLPSALVSTWLRRKQGSVDLRQLLPGIAAGCAGAFGMALLRQGLDPEALRTPFGILLLGAGLRELLYKEKPLPSPGGRCRRSGG
mgnify:FL=1